MQNINPYSSPVSVAASVPDPNAKHLTSQTYWGSTVLVLAISPTIFAICEYFDSAIGFFALNLIFWPPVIVGLVVSYMLLVNADSVPKRVASSAALLVNFGVGLATLLLTLMFSGLRPTG